MLLHHALLDAVQEAARQWTAPRSLLEAMNAPTGGKSVAVQVYVNHGRWIVECPDCRGAQLASPTDRRFMCSDCGNVDAGGAWRPVIWPSDKQAATIEELLALRPVENQNWRPGETARQLHAENRERMGAA